MFYVFDGGHSEHTIGKASPDGQLREYAYNREIIKRVSEKLDALSIRYAYTYPLTRPDDLSLSKRAEVASAYARGMGVSNTLLISVHSNAAGNGTEWKSAKGWAVYTTKGNTNSDKYATIFAEEAEKVCKKYGRKVRKDTSDGDPDYEENFTIIYKSICPSILIEEFFYDNLEEKEWMMTEEGKDACATIIVNAIRRIEGR